MSRRSYIIIIVLVILLIVGAVGYLFYAAKKKAALEGRPAPTLAEFFPFLGSNTFPSGTTPDGTTPPPDDTILQDPDTQLRPRLLQITARSIAGATSLLATRNIMLPVFDSELETFTTEETPTMPVSTGTEEVASARFVERETGHIYESFLDTAVESRVSNTTIPRIEEAFFGAGGNSVILRYAKEDNQTIETYAGVLSGAITSADSSGVSTLKELTGTFLPQNILDLVVSPDGTKIFYNLKTEGGVVGTMANVDGSGKKQVFMSPFSEWLMSWPAQNILSATTKASGLASGYTYSVDPLSGLFTKIIGPISGLTTNFNPGGSLFLYGVSKQTSNQLALYDVKNQSSTTLGLSTLPEKCTWNTTGTVVYCGVPENTPAGLYPDIWYKGVVSFTDSIWKIDIASRASNILINPLAALGHDLDVVDPFIDTTGRYLIFTNKKDSTLWRYDLGL